MLLFLQPLLLLFATLSSFPTGLVIAFPRSSTHAASQNSNNPPQSAGNFRLVKVIHSGLTDKNEPTMYQHSPGSLNMASASSTFKLSKKTHTPEWSLLSNRKTLSKQNLPKSKNLKLNLKNPSTASHTAHAGLNGLYYQSQNNMDDAFSIPKPMSPKYKNMLIPDPTDPETVLSFARMTYDAYYEPEDKAWIPVPGWNVSGRFGWQTSGIRGYVFVDDTEHFLVIVIKGTSLSTPIGSGPTAQLDKLNDNLMFSCCCAKGGWGWTPICSCPISSTQCSNSCLLKESSFEGSYYNLAQTIYLAVKEWFPNHTNIWMTGHSLGGALAALVALTNDLPAFAYEAPGDLLYASRLGLLPNLPDLTDFLNSVPIFHYGNDGDPIFLGQCAGVTSSCYWLGYALETKCHIGKQCVYSFNEAQKELSPNTSVSESSNSESGQVHTQSSIRYHSIDFVIKRFLENAQSVPKCAIQPACLATECTGWSFVD
ncbi:putative lipase atg15 [Batrachochytrium dendrobatidis]